MGLRFRIVQSVILERGIVCKRKGKCGKGRF